MQSSKSILWVHWRIRNLPSIMYLENCQRKNLIFIDIPDTCISGFKMVTTDVKLNGCKQTWVPGFQSNLSTDFCIRYACCNGVHGFLFRRGNTGSPICIPYVCNPGELLTPGSDCIFNGVQLFCFSSWARSEFLPWEKPLETMSDLTALIRCVVGVLCN